MKIRQLIGILIILLLLLIGATYVIQERVDVSSHASSAAVGSTDGTGASSTDASKIIEREVIHIVSFTDTGFIPDRVTVNAGEFVRFVNESKSDMWVASMPHNTHSALSDSSFPTHCQTEHISPFDQCASSDRYQYRFMKTGQWEFHNHLMPQHKGEVVVR